MLSASASLGLLLLWDTDIGLSHVDKYTYSSEEHIKAGALLATGILNCGVRNEADAAMALLSEQVDNNSVALRTNAIVGYAPILPLRTQITISLVSVLHTSVLIEKISSLSSCLTSKMTLYQWRSSPSLHFL